MFWLMSLVLLWFWNRGLPYLTPTEHEQAVSFFRLKPDISVHTGSYPSLVLDPSLRTWLVTERTSHAVWPVLFQCQSSVKIPIHATWYSRRQWIRQPVPRHILISLKTRLLLCQRRSRLAFSCVPSLRSFLNQPPQMNHHCWAMLNYSLPHHPKFHLNNLLVHLSLHSCESQWSFLNGNWLVNMFLSHSF